MHVYYLDYLDEKSIWLHYVRLNNEHGTTEHTRNAHKLYIIHSDRMTNDFELMVI